MFILALTDEEEIVLVRQYRPALGIYTIEFPAGSIDPGETPLDAIKRELLEETGYVCRDIRPLGRGRLMSNRLNAWEYMFLGLGAARHSSYTPSEDFALELVPKEELMRLIWSGDFNQLAAFAVIMMADLKAGVPFARGEPVD